MQYISAYDMAMMVMIWLNMVKYIIAAAGISNKTFSFLKPDTKEAGKRYCYYLLHARF